MSILEIGSYAYSPLDIIGKGFSSMVYKGTPLLTKASTKPPATLSLSKWSTLPRRMQLSTPCLITSFEPSSSWIIRLLYRPLP